ncbi:MAG TPA: hypothetical protein DIT58_07155 [Porticoccaceae bacterium]|nr:hypothetical protein [Porticoccaceae bacterium]
MLSIITITQLKLNLTAMLTLTVASYFAAYINILLIVSRIKKPKVINMLTSSLLVIAIFPFGCLLFLIANWKIIKEK